VVSFYQTLVNDLSTDLAQFERMKKITLLPQEFTLEAGELTPTLKVKRRFVEQKYQALIDAMYEGAGG
jgi:long-chain acyl-CoA synthetase